MLRILLAILTLIMLSLGSRVAWSDDPPTKPAQNKSDLTEGLMDLLREPAKDKSDKPPTSQPSIVPIPANSTNKPGFDGEDIGQGPSSPLADIQLEMNTLAGWMRGKPDVSRTKELQRNIVLRLDEMIEQLERQSSSQSNAASSSAPSSQSQNSSAQDQSARQSDVRSTDAQQAAGSDRTKNQDSAQRPGAAEPTNADPNGSEQAQGQSANRPGQSSGGGDPESAPGQPGVSPIRPRSVNVDLNDPRALQRSAWGNLPERMREQMQSRMVERFLPPYRDEIEAYYRALGK